MPYNAPSPSDEDPKNTAKARLGILFFQGIQVHSSEVRYCYWMVLERSALGYVHQPPIFTFKFRTSKNQCSAASVLAARMAGVTARSSLETEKGSYRIAAD